MKKIKISLYFILIIISHCGLAKAQSVKQTYFSQESSKEVSDKGYGSIEISTEKGETKVISYIMAFGNNVKGIYLKVNDGFNFELAPAEQGLNLNYIGSSLNIVIKDGDKIKIELMANDNGKKIAVRHIYLSGYSLK